MKLIEHNAIINEVVNHINYLLTLTEDAAEDAAAKELNDKNRSIALTKVKTNLTDLESKVRGIEKKSKKRSYSNVKIKFFNEIKLSVRSSSDKTTRTLKGDMYFTVVGETSNYIDIQTRNITKGVAIRLYFDKLQTLMDQHGKVQLVYSENGNFSGGVDRKSDEKDIKFRFNDLKK
jgi:hypothetical protein